MTPNQMLKMMRRYLNDEQATGFTEGGNLEQPEGTQELLSYLDRAVDEYSKMQATRGDIRLIKKLTLRNGELLPSDFLSLCGTVPMTVTNKTIELEYGSADIPAKYFARLPYVSDYGMDNELPYETDQSNAICALGTIYALNKHEFNVSQDLMLLGYGVNANANAEQ